MGQARAQTPVPSAASTLASPASEAPGKATGAPVAGWGRRNVAKHRTSLWTAFKGVLPTRSLSVYVSEPGVSASSRSIGPIESDPRDATASNLAPHLALLRDALRRDVSELAGPLAGRGLHMLPRLRSAEEWIQSRLQHPHLHIERQTFICEGIEVANYHATLEGATPEVFVVGSHYDAVALRAGICPAANDNGSGVAATLALAHHFAERAQRGERPPCTLRFSLWVNEEPPYFWTRNMGSDVDARRRKDAREKIIGMITPETIGCYSSEPGSQRYPPVPFLRDQWNERIGTRGDFIAFLGMSESREFVRACTEGFRAASPSFRCLGAALPALVLGVGASDHWSFWKQGYPALMVTDTAPFRYPYYHTPDDTPDKMNFEMMARVVDGLQRTVQSVMEQSVRTARTPPQR